MKKCLATLFALALCASPALSATPALNCKYVMGSIVAMTYSNDGNVKIAFKEAGTKTTEILEGKPIIVMGKEASSAPQLYRKFTDRAATDTFTIKVSTDEGKLMRVELPPFLNQTAEPAAAGEEGDRYEDAVAAIPDPTTLGKLAATYSEGRLAAINNGWPLAVYIDSTPPVLPFTVTSLDDGKFPWKAKGDVVWLIPNKNVPTGMAYVDPSDAPPAGYCAECVKQTQYKGYTIQCGPTGCKLVPNAKTTGGMPQPSPCTSCQQCVAPAASYGGCGGCQGGCSGCQTQRHHLFPLRRGR